MHDQSLYRKVSVTIDVACLVGFPLALGIWVKLYLAISVFAIIAVVAFLRRRYLDEKAETLVLGAAPSLGYPVEQTPRSRVDGRPIRIMVLAAGLVTAVPIVSIVIQFVSGEAVTIWLIGCTAAIWFGVTMTAVGQWLGRRSR